MAQRIDRAASFGQNLYVDTRGAAGEPVPFTQAVINGLAQGGGLYVPEELPTLSLDEICALARLPYAQRAAAIYKAFNVDLPDEAIDELMGRAYGDNFDDEAICPITSLDESTHILELWHGPTSAFKDMALQCLPHFFSASAEKLREEGTLDHEFMILVATSGDTGKAALEGFKGVDRRFHRGAVPRWRRERHPAQADGHHHRRQRAGVGRARQLSTTARPASSTPLPTRSSPRSCWTSTASPFPAPTPSTGGGCCLRWSITSPAMPNSWRRARSKPGCPIDVCVPTGNFGNILAAWYAKQIGVPIERLLCASNDNRVLTDFINTGTYDISDREFILTSSPSMDILVSSNLERQLFELTGRNGEAIRQWMADLADARCFRVDAETFRRVRENFSADSVDNATCLATIREVLDAHDYLLDPHTAVAYAAAQNLRGENPVLIASTAHWAKFGNNVYRAIHGIEPSGELPADVAALTGCELNKLIAEETDKHHIPAGLANLDTMQLRFTEVIDNDVEAIEDAAEAFLTR